MILEYRDGRWDEIPGAITREYLSDYFGFDRGDRFDSPEEVREYFLEFTDRGNYWRQHYDAAIPLEAAARFAEEVIRHSWHCNF